MIAAKRITGVAPDVAGSVLVDEEELARKLGRAAWLVWQIMAAKRSHDGTCRTYGSALMNARGYQKICRTQMHKAVRRLEKAGLIERLGYQSLPTNTKVGVKQLPVYTRKVFGARALHLVGSTAQILVPAATAKWAASATTWGGVRSGAGRPSDQTRVLRSRAIQEGSVDLAIKGGPIMGIPKSVGKKSLTELRSSSKSESCPAEPGNFSSLVETTETEIGTVIGGKATRRAVAIIGNPVEGLPPFPGNAIVSGAQVPHPPLLKQAAKSAELVTELMKWYRGALEAVYDIRLPRRKKITVKKKDRDILLSAAAHLFEHQIPPAVWCAWRCDRYKNAKVPAGAKRPVHPPIAYVFSERMLTDDRWQFRAVWGDARIGGRVIYGKKFRALYEAYRALLADVNNGMTKSAAVSKHFPGERYNEMLDAAKIEAVETYNKIYMQIERGEYVWPV